MDFDYTKDLPLLSNMLENAMKQFGKDIKLQSNITDEDRAQISEMERVANMARETTNEIARKAKKRK